MNWMSFMTHFACAVLGGTVGVAAMALCAASGSDGGATNVVRCFQCGHYDRHAEPVGDGARWCKAMAFYSKPLDYCSRAERIGK